MSAQVPPHDLDAERAVLGALLVSAKAADKVLGGSELGATDFYLDRHRVIFGCANDLHSEGDPVDEISLADALKRRGKIEAAGGRAYISELAATVPAAGNATHYAEIVRRCAGERAVREVAHDLLDRLSPAEAIERLRLLETNPGGRVRLPWRWSDEVAADTPAEPEWIFEGYIAKGTKTLFAGLPKGGKTTIVAALVEAIAAGAGSFLGRQVADGPVVLMSEEGDATLAPKLRGFPDGRVRVIALERKLHDGARRALRANGETD